MERKIDPGIREDIDRGKEQASGNSNPLNNVSNEDAMTPESDAIKNANAAGLGAIGRNDQRQTGSAPGGASDTQNEY